MNALASVPGAVLLVGAGKMGGALLESWLARGLPPALVVGARSVARAGRREVARGETHRARSATAAHRQSRCPRAGGEAAGRAFAHAASRALCRARHGCRIDHGGQDARISYEASAEGHGDCARDAEHAGRDRTRHYGRGSERARERQCARSRGCIARHNRSGRVDQEREVDGCGNGGLRARGRPTFSCWRRAWRAPELRRACRSRLR